MHPVGWATAHNLGLVVGVCGAAVLVALAVLLLGRSHRQALLGRLVDSLRLQGTARAPGPSPDTCLLVTE